MDWEWPLSTDAKRRIRINYEDMMGQRSEREIAPQALFGQRVRRRSTGEIDILVEQVRGYCYLRRDERTFNLASIGEMVDAETGEHHPDPFAWAEARVANQTGRRRERETVLKWRQLEETTSPEKASWPLLRAWRAIALVAVIGYLIGRRRVIPWLLHLFGSQHGLWL